MDAEQFIRWALDATRTLEERYTTELVVEQGVRRWNSRRGIYESESFTQMNERKRQRALNPAYEPRYTEESLRKTAEVLDSFTSWSTHGGLDERPLRNLAVFRFMQALKDLSLAGEFEDLSVLSELPNLRKLQLMSRTCEDYRPLARCRKLTELSLSLWRSYLKPTTLWPDVSGLEQLEGLEVLSLEGNLLTFPRGITWPKVRRAVLKCCPVDSRDMRDLPQLPACEFLTLGGAEKLDGIEAYPRLRNLTIETVVRDFSPLTALEQLTWLTCKEHEPLDVAPLARVPKLHFIAFDTTSKVRLEMIKPRDFSPLVEAPQLRELKVKGCPPVMTEVAALNAGLPPWDDLFLRDQTRPSKALRVVVSEWSEMEKRGWKSSGQPGPEIDLGLGECEGRWVSRFVTKQIGKEIGSSDWGTATADGQLRQIRVEIHSFDAVEKLPQILDVAHKAMARLKNDYQGVIWIQLKATRRKPTKAEKELLRKFEEEQENAEFERRQREQAEYQERLHRYELKKQEGQKIKPEEFAPGAEQPLPPAPWERDEESESDDEDGGGLDIAVKKKPDPPPMFDDDEHPLADKYSLMGRFTSSEVWFPIQQHGLVSYLMGREPDEVIPGKPTQ